MRKTLKRIWYFALMVASTVLFVIPTGIVCLVSSALAMLAVVLIDIITVRDLPEDHYRTLFHGWKDDRKNLGKYARVVIGAIVYMYESPDKK